MSLKKLKLSSLSDDDIDNLFLHPRSHQDVERLLHRNLFLLGEGGFSAVFKYENRSIKFGIYQDRCWYQFGVYVMKHNNKHYPKIYRLKAFKNEGYFLAEMESLKPMKSLDELRGKDEYSVIADIISSRGDIDEVEKIMDSERNDPIIKALKPFAEDESCYLDLHLGNWMWRGNTLVINDPVA